MIQRDSDFLRLEVYSASIQAFEDCVDAALVFGRLLLLDDSRVNNAIIQPATVLWL